MDYAALMQYARTDRQREVLDACLAHGSQRKAAKALGIARQVIGRSIQSVQVAAARQGYSPEHDMTRPAPVGYKLKGTSTYYDEDGKVRGQWVKTQADNAEQLRLLEESLLATFADIEPLKPVKAPERANEDLLTVYPLGDPHLGMYSWAEEAGEDFDLKIATTDLKAATDRLVATSPPSHTAILLNLGDFFHSDNMEGKTRRSGNVLDVDTRWARVLSMGVETMIHLIRRMLEKHQRVIVRNNIGNHDEHSSIMLAIALQAFFRDNERVEIDTSPSPFWYVRHGQVLIGSTHGDRTKPPDLPQIMATDRAQDWGETKYRYWYTGHIHHHTRHEFRGCQVESFRTLAASDAWHHGQGYRSGRDMHCIVHHSSQGDLERHRIGVEQL